MLEFQQNGGIMKKYFEKYGNIPLFEGISQEDLDILFGCLNAKIMNFEKDRAVFSAGECVKQFGIVLSGQVSIVHNDYYGNRSILSKVESGNLFTEAFAFAGISLPVSVVTATQSQLLFLDSSRFASTCVRGCVFHNRLIQNLIKITAEKNINLIEKFEVISKCTTREKLLTFLSNESKKAGSREFVIPFNRQELADYIFVERTAMSAELSKLKKEGLIDYKKNKFVLL